METLIWTALFFAFVYWRAISEYPELKEMIKGRNEKQQEVIKYFFGVRGLFGFMKKRISDQEYDVIVNNTIQSLNLKQKAMDKIGLDESEISEIDPVYFQGWVFGKNKSVNFAKYGKDGKPRSSAYQITWLFFSDTQVYIYNHTIHFDKDDQNVTTEEYFYKDITNFSTVTDTVEQEIWNNILKKFEVKNINSSKFSITVPGDKLYCSVEQGEYAERAVQAMKAKLREKKSQ